MYNYSIVKYILLLIVILSTLFLFQRTKKSEKIFVPNQTQVNRSEKVSVIAQNLDTPWEMVFISDKNILVTERKGAVSEINIQNGKKEMTFDIKGVKEIGEGGLLGMALDPDFRTNNYIYFYYTYEGEGDKTLNRIIRMKYENKSFSKEEVLVDNIPGASNHNGGRIKFGPDGFLYVTTGDAQDSSRAQDVNSLSGKILRITRDGRAAPNNPFNNLVFSFGHRNPQGLAWDGDNNLWATEHGRSGITSGLDELNKIEMGKNYGWPEIQGDETKEGMIIPMIHSGATTTWAPSGITYLNGSLFWSGLRGQTLYEGIIDVSKILLKEHFKNEFGRLRNVVVGPDNMLYITTSNHDGRGNPKKGDDKIIRIDPLLLE